MQLNQYSWDPEKDKLAEGGFAEVFRARDEYRPGKHVVLKIYKEAISKGSSASDGLEKYTLEKEFANIDGLSHTHLITYYGLEYIKHADAMGRESKYPVIIMEYASEGSLKDFIKTNPNEATVDLLIKQIIDGVSYLHKQGAIHRDLKPGNILIGRDRNDEPEVKITDFGISRDVINDVTTEQSYTAGIGTPHYMAPEQFFKKEFGLDGEISFRTDAWSLGVVIYWMLTSKLPFGDGITDYELVRDAIVKDELNTDGLADKYLQVVKECLSKNASERPEETIFISEGDGIITTSKITNEDEPTIIKVQSNEKTEGLKPFSSGKFYGYENHHGEVVVALKYESASPFSEGLAAVKKNGCFGYINQKGEEIIDFKYAEVHLFSNGRARVRKADSYFNQKYGFVDNLGEMVTNDIYNDAKDFSEEMAAIKKERKWGFINLSGDEIIPPTFALVYSFSGGLAKVAKESFFTDRKFGFINKNGRIVIPLVYDGLGSFNDGLASAKKKYLSGYVNKEGIEVIPFQYDLASGFKEGLARVRIKEKYGFIDKDGREVITIQYGKADDFSNGTTKVTLKNETFSIDINGNRIE